MENKHSQNKKLGKELKGCELYIEKIKKISNHDLYTIIFKWWQHLSEEKGYSTNTQEAYLSDVLIFLNYLSVNNTQISIKTLKNSDISDFRGFLHNISEQRTASSRVRTLSTLRSLYNYIEKSVDNFKNEAIFMVKSPKKVKKLPRALNVDHTLKAIDAISEVESFKNNSEYWVSLRDEVLLMLIYSCGLRISEALNLKISDIHDSGYVKIFGKGSKERLVPIMGNVEKSLKSLIEACPYCDKESKEQLIFYGKQGRKLDPAVFQKTVRQVKAALGLPEGTTPHAFRHSFATHLLANSGELRPIQDLLGHESLESTQIYTKLDTTNLLKNFNDFS